MKFPIFSKSLNKEQLAQLKNYSDEEKALFDLNLAIEAMTRTFMLAEDYETENYRKKASEMILNFASGLTVLAKRMKAK